MKIGEMTDEDRAVLERVRVTHHAWRLAETKLQRCSKPASIDAARVAYELAEREYREAAAARDAHVARRNVELGHAPPATAAGVLLIACKLAATHLVTGEGDQQEIADAVVDAVQTVEPGWSP